MVKRIRKFVRLIGGTFEHTLEIAGWYLGGKLLSSKLTNTSRFVLKKTNILMPINRYGDLTVIAIPLLISPFAYFFRSVYH